MEILQLQEFFVEGGNHEKSHVLLHITEPSTPEEKKKGYFFAVCEINQATTKHIVALQNIIDEIENRYYETPETENQNALEAVLTKINQTSLTLLHHNIPINCVVGTLRQQEMIFSFYGKPQMFLFYRNRENIYQKMDLISSNANEENETDTQLFSQIIQGKISPNDYVFVSTPKVIEYFNPDRLQKIITTRPARQSAEHLERVLSELKNDLSFGGLIIHLNKPEENVMAVKKARLTNKGDSERSLHSLFSTEKNTASTLAPSLLPRWKDKFQSAWDSNFNKTEVPQTNPIAEPTPAIINSTHARPHQPSKIKPQKDTTQTILIIIWSFLKTTTKYIGLGIWWLILLLGAIISGLGRGLLSLFFITTNYQNRRQNVLADTAKQWRNYKISIQQLPLLTKILFFIALATITLLIFGISWLKIKQNNLAIEKQYQATIQVVMAKKDAAESALIYNDETTALNELAAAKNLLNNLSACTDKSKKIACENLNEQLENIFIRLRKIVTVKPELLSDWSETNTTLQRISKIENLIIAISPSSSKLFIYDQLTRSQKNAEVNFASGFTALAAPKENDYLALIYNQNKLAVYNPKNNTVEPADISYPKTNSIISDIVVYNRRLYSLDTNNNQIYKHDSIKTGFGPGKEWLKDSTVNIKDGVDLTIDGDLYVSKNNGQIEKITAGKKQPFAIQGLDPILTAGGSIYTYNDVNYLYLLDTTGKRLLILEKDGRLKSQITTSEWQAPNGLVVDETNKRAFILDSNKLYQIILP